MMPDSGLQRRKVGKIAEMERCCPKCGSAEYTFRGRTKTAEDGKPEEWETEYRCKTCKHEWKDRMPVCRGAVHTALLNGVRRLYSGAEAKTGQPRKHSVPTSADQTGVRKTVGEKALREVVWVASELELHVAACFTAKAPIFGAEKVRLVTMSLNAVDVWRRTSAHKETRG